MILKPANLDVMNRRLSAVASSRSAQRQSERTRLRIEKDEVLLAVIHGYGPNDWRDPEATQTFVLKNVVGKDLRVQNRKRVCDGKQRTKVAASTRRPDR